MEDRTGEPQRVVGGGAGARPARSDRRIAAALRRTGDRVLSGVDRDNLDPRTRRLLEAPIVPMLVRLGAPNVLIMLAQAAVGLIETFFVGKLGTDALAGMALVFPAVMLMQTISAGAFGGAIASVIARALGGGRRAEADILVSHALAIALALGLLFMGV